MCLKGKKETKRNSASKRKSTGKLSPQWTAAILCHCQPFSKLSHMLHIPTYIVICWSPHLSFPSVSPCDHCSFPVPAEKLLKMISSIFAELASHLAMFYPMVCFRVCLKPEILSEVQLWQGDRAGGRPFLSWEVLPGMEGTSWQETIT